MLSFEEFSAAAAHHQVVPIYEKMFSGSETPLGIFEKVARGQAGSFLLESAEQGVWSRFSFVGVSTLGQITEQSGEVSWFSERGLAPLPHQGSSVSGMASLDAIALIQHSWQSAPIAELPPLVSGMVGFLGWQGVNQIEAIQLRNPKAYQSADLAFVLIEDLIAVDHKDSSLWVISNAYLHEGTDPREVYDRATERIATMRERLLLPSEPFLAEVSLSATGPASSSHTEEQFCETVERAKRHVVAGDVFQVVVSQRFNVDCTASAVDVYRMLRALNPSPYMYLLNLTDSSGAFAIVGSSPEALVRVESRRAVLHPIAGSRPRGATAEADSVLAQELLEDQKERAEHLMLVDLARNDLLKVCDSATVRVSEFMTIERYSHVMHLVSTVEGDLLGHHSAVDVLKATFPAGTLSGAPKPRAIEIIEDLEGSHRGIFGGVVGYFDFAGNADLAIAIRTAFIRDSVAYIQAGAGIVLDSDPKTEYQETINKASAPIRAVHAANQLRRYQ